MYAYSIGVRTSRAIERRCCDDVAFRVITANQMPDHATIARFRVRHETAIAELFGGVLELCARAGLVDVGVVAVDGTKIAAAATHHATRTYEQIAQARSSRTRQRLDAAEDELFGEARGDELPEGLRTSGERRKWLREAKQAMDAQRAAPGQEDPARPRRAPSPMQDAALSKTGSLSGALSPSTRRGLRPGSPATGRGGCSAPRYNIKPYPLVPIRRAGKINVSDPDSRNLKTTRGWVQGYNAQAVVTWEQIVIARRSHGVAGHRQPATDDRKTAGEELQAAGVSEPGRRGAGRRRLLEERRDRRADQPEASACSSHPTPTAARGLGPVVAAAAMTSPRRVLATDAGKQALSETTRVCRARFRSDQSQTVARTASCAAADRPSDPNGGYLTPPTTCSSSTSTKLASGA